GTARPAGCGGSSRRPDGSVWPAPVRPAARGETSWSWAVPSGSERAGGRGVGGELVPDRGQRLLGGERTLLDDPQLRPHRVLERRAGAAVPGGVGVDGVGRGARVGPLRVQGELLLAL